MLWWKMDFLKKSVHFNVGQATKLTNPLNTWFTTINVASTDWYENSWSLLICWDVINYTNKNATQFLWVTWISKIHEIGELVEPMFKLPTDCDKITGVLTHCNNGNTVPLQYNPSQFWIPNYWTSGMTEITDSWQRYALIRLWYGIKSCSVEYYSIPPYLVNPWDLCVLPWENGVELLALIVAGELLRETEEEQHAVKLLKLWYNKLHMFFKDQSESIKRQRNTVKVKNSTYKRY